MKPILILGMHRSGTSALCGGLESAGLIVGEVSKKNLHNQCGNRESSDIVGANDALLEESKATWDSPERVQSCGKRKLLRCAKAIAPICAVSSRQNSRWGFKDPRTVFTVAVWEQLFPFDRAYCFRHPAAVARSLMARESMPLAKGLRLWEVYNRELIRLMRHVPGPLVSFDTSPGEYTERVQATAQILCLPYPQAASQFFSPKLQHQTRDPSIVLSREQQSIYDELQDIYAHFWH